MNKVKIILRDIDIKPISGATVRLSSGGQESDLQTDATGVTPAAALTGSTFRYSASHSDFAPDSGGGTFELSGGQPTGSIGKGQVLSVKWYLLGGDNIVEVAVVLGKIAAPLSKGCFIQPWRSLDSPLNPIHGTGKNGWDRFNASHNPLPADPPGDYFTCEVIGLGLPRLVAMWRPQSVDLRSNQPVNFLVYFHPFRPPKGPYPFDPDYVELGRTYLGNPRRTISHMTQQGIRAIAMVPIFPLDSDQYASLTMTQVYRLVREVNFFLQMQAGAQLLTQWRVQQPVGKVAVCCFSRSIDALAALLNQRGDDAAKAAEFYDQKLREVYAFDPVPDVAAQFMAGLVPWFRQGADGRRFRLYTEFDPWVEAFLGAEKALGGTTAKPDKWDVGPRQISREWHGPGETFAFAHCSAEFVQSVVDLIRAGVPPSLDADPGMAVHSFFPGYFMGHALAGSSLR